MCLVKHETSSTVTPAHLAALQHCGTSLATLTYEHWSEYLDDPAQPITDIMAGIAMLSGLTQLELSLTEANWLNAQLNPLSQLTQVQDLTLRSPDRLSCDAVLCSSRHSLHHIRLAAESYSPATSQAPQQIPHLDMLRVIIWESMSSRHASCVANLTANRY